MLAIGEATFGYREYYTSSVAPIASDRDGYYVKGEIGALVPINRKTELLATYRYEYKDANKSYEAYSSNRLRLRMVYVLPANDFFYIDASVNRIEWDEPNPFIAPDSTRLDLDTRVQATYGVPIKDLLNMVSMNRTFGNSILSFSTEFYDQNSNRTGYDFSNFRFSMYLTTNWDL